MFVFGRGCAFASDTAVAVKPYLSEQVQSNPDAESSTVPIGAV